MSPCKFFGPVLLFGYLAIAASCSSEGANERPILNENRLDPTDWLIPKDEIFDVGIGKDGIPSVDNPQFDDPSYVNPAFDEELVLGIEIDGELKAYPIPILDWHEIVNDELSGEPYSITYCPLTGTGVGWSRRIGNTVTSFGVSGLLYNTNLMPYDRRTNSTWSQQRMECIHGLRIGDRPLILNLIETKFSTWKASFPESRIMTANTGFDRRYSIYPYGDYRENQDRLIFPVDHLDKRLAAKERVLGIVIDNSAKAYRFNPEHRGIEVLSDVFMGINLVVVRSSELNFIASFFNPDNLEFKAVQDSLPAIMEDQNGTKYNLAGHALDHSTPKLEKPTSFMGFWFSWGAFYPGIEIFEE